MSETSDQCCHMTVNNVDLARAINAIFNANLFGDRMVEIINKKHKEFVKKAPKTIKKKYYETVKKTLDCIKQFNKAKRDVEAVKTTMRNSTPWIILNVCWMIADHADLDRIMGNVDDVKESNDNISYLHMCNGLSTLHKLNKVCSLQCLDENVEFN